MIDIRVLGTLAIQLSDGNAPAVTLTQPKRLALLLYLALAEPSGPQSRESLMALLWPEADDESARHSLRNALYGLRQTLGEQAVVSRGEGYVGLDPSAIRCDALELRRLLADQRWEEAFALWGGDFVPGFHVSEAAEFEQWLDNQRSSLRRAITGAAWRWVDEMERKGDPGVVSAAQRAWALEPGNEAGARRLMRFLDASIGRAPALRAYDELADYLRRECEAEPSAETRALASELKARIEPRPSGFRAVPTAEQSPDLQTMGTEAEPSRPLARRRGISTTTAAIAGGLLMAGLVSLFALRPAGSPLGRTSTVSGDPVAMAEGRGLLRLPLRYRKDTSAYGSYLRGLALRFTAAPSVSRDTFEALVNREPLYAPGLSGLAHAYAFSTFSGELPPAEGWAKVEAAADKAIALDSASASAYLALGLMEMSWRWNLPRGRELIDRGLALEPADPEAHALLGAWFRWQAEMDSAVAEARKSLELDPLNPMWGNRLARQLYLAEQYPEAETMYRRMLRDYPGNGLYSELSDIYRAQGRMREALALLRTGAEATGDSAALAELPRAISDSQAARVFADRARQEIRDLETGKRAGEWVPPAAFALAYADLKDKDETLRWLDSMLVGRDPALKNVRAHPVYDFLRDDPRYQAWEAKLPGRKVRPR